MKEFGNENILFVHAHNKQTVKEVVRLLKDATIPVCAIVDIDILNSSDELQSVLSALECGEVHLDVLAKRQEVARMVDQRAEGEILGEMISGVAEFLEQLRLDKHELSGARSALQRLRRDSTKWSAAKRKGLQAFPDQKRDIVQLLIDELGGRGLFVVPVGELEGWLEVGTTRKNKWIVLALEALSQGRCSEQLRGFIDKVLSYMGENLPSSAAKTP